jgi:uncharacterized protein YaaN involved in tellurite resistance
MKTKLDQRLEINADFEILDTHNPANMPVSNRPIFKQELQNVQSVVQQFVDIVDIAKKNNDQIIKDVITKAKEIEQDNDCLNKMKEKVRRVMPYFYCQ